MLDTHLIYVALTAFGIAAGAGVLVAAAIIAIAGLRHRSERHVGRPAGMGGNGGLPVSVEREPVLR